MTKKIILASASPRRKELLEQIGIEFRIEPSDAEENIEIEDPIELVSELSKLKADDVWQKNKNSCIIAADTIVFAQGKILGKPINKSDGERMLKMLSGNKHTVYTGVTVQDKNGTITIVDSNTKKILHSFHSKNRAMILNIHWSISHSIITLPHRPFHECS